MRDKTVLCTQRHGVDMTFKDCALGDTLCPKSVSIGFL